MQIVPAISLLLSVMRAIADGRITTEEAKCIEQDLKDLLSRSGLGDMFGIFKG